MDQVSYHRVYCGSFLERPSNIGSIVVSDEWGPPRRVSTGEGKRCLLKYQCHQLEVRIGNAPMGVVGTDRVCHDVLRPRQAPNVVYFVLIWVNLYPSTPYTRGVGVAHVSSK